MNSKITPFKGAYVNAELASSYIDAATICAGCDLIDTAAHDFYKVGNKVTATAGICSAKALEVEGTTMVGNIETCGESITALEEEIKSITAGIRAKVQEVLDDMQMELNAVAQKEDEERKRLASAEAASTTE